MKPKLNMTVKAWKKFDDEHKIHLQKKFDIILIDHKTKSEKAISTLKKFNVKNLNRGIDKFNRGVDSFHGIMDDLSSSLNNTKGQKWKKENRYF